MTPIRRVSLLVRRLAVALVLVTLCLGRDASAQRAPFLELVGEELTAAILGERAALPALRETPSYEVFKYEDETLFHDVRRSKLFKVRGAGTLDEAVSSCEDLLTRGRVKINVYDEAAGTAFVTEARFPTTYESIREVFLTDGVHGVERPAIQVVSDAGVTEKVVRIHEDGLLFARLDAVPVAVLESGLRASPLERADIHIVSLIDDTHVDDLLSTLAGVRYTRLGPKRIGDLTKIIAGTKRGELLAIFSHAEGGAFRFIGDPSPGIRIDAVRAAVKAANVRVLAIGCGAAIASNLPGTLDIVYAIETANRIAQAVDTTNVYDFLVTLGQRIVVDASLIEVPKELPPAEPPSSKDAARAEYQLWQALNRNVRVSPNLAITLPAIKAAWPLDAETPSSDAAPQAPATTGLDAGASWGAGASWDAAASWDTITGSPPSLASEAQAQSNTWMVVLIVITGLGGGGALYAFGRRV